MDDLEQAVQRSVAAGAIQEQAVHEHAWGRIAGMSDPFGHGYCLIEFSSVGYDAIASRPEVPSMRASRALPWPDT